MNYKDHDHVLELLAKDQEAEYDLREEIDEIIRFLNHPEGQWEPEILKEFEGRPRYTFDMCGPAVSKAWAEMAANEYAVATQPISGGASEEVSDVLDGLLRSINSVSSFDSITTRAGKRMIATGFGAWRIVSKYVDADCFYQDLVKVPVNNAHRRVWFDCSAEMNTMEDAMHVHHLSEVSKAKAEKLAGRAPEGLDTGRDNSSYDHKPADSVVLGEILYKKAIKKTIYLLEDDSYTVVDDKGLEAAGLTPDSPQVLESREADAFEVYSRKYDKKGWLGAAEKTVFDRLPIIPLYANFDITEGGKKTYQGLIRRVMDHQRVFNYAESRKVEESVLQPRRKLFMDDRLAAGYTDELSNINRDPRAVQLFNGQNARDSSLPFFETSGPTPNPAVSEVAENMKLNFQISTGLPNDLSLQEGTNKDSDFRFNQRTSMGQVGTFEFYKALQVALEYDAKVTISAIPKVYDTFRKVRTLDEAGQSSEMDINKRDKATGQLINDLTTGKYDVTVSIGKDFESRQAEANSAILELGSINPEVVMRNTDVIANNMKSPGMSTVADRERAYLFKQGLIPEDQMTDKEKEQYMAAQQQTQQPDPGAMIAEAEMQKAQAETAKVQTQGLIEQAKLEQQQMKMQLETLKAEMDLELRRKNDEIDNLKKLAETDKILAETQGMGSQASVEQDSLIINQQKEV